MTDSEQRRLRQLVDLFADTEQWVRRISDVATAEPQAGSPLYGDNQRTGMYPVSGLAWNHLTVAIDHLSTLRVATVGCAEHESLSLHLHLNGQFTLLRAIIENASAALWLLGPTIRNDRVLRRLQFAAADIRNNEAIRAVMKSPGRKTKDQRLDEVRAIAAARGLDPKQAVRGPGFEEIVRAAGEATELGENLAVVLWRACSGLAHGDIWASITLPGREHLPSATAGMANLRLSPNVEGLCTALLAAKILIGRAFALYELRCQAAI